MGRKRLHPHASDAPKGGPTLGTLLARKRGVVDVTVDDSAAPSDCAEPKDPESEAQVDASDARGQH